jgi:hypothetical protein
MLSVPADYVLSSLNLAFAERTQFRPICRETRYGSSMVIGIEKGPILAALSLFGSLFEPMNQFVFA